MGVRESTKYLFASAIQELIITKDLRAIRIKDLCDSCGADRQTFYYHFHDKYELVAWIYLKDLEQSVRDNNGIYDQNQLACLLHRLNRQRSFYRKVFSDQTQNALAAYIYQYNVKNTEYLLKKRLNTDTLSRELQFAVQFHASAWVNCMIRWILEPSDLTADELASLIYANLPPLLKETFQDDLPFHP